MTDFGDIEPDDVWDDDPTIDPLQVAIRLHRFRRVVDLLAGADDLGDWEDLSKRDRDDGVAVGVVIVEFVDVDGLDHPALMAEAVHAARRQADGDIAEWDGLSGDERAIAIDLMRLIVEWLRREGPR